MPLTSTISATAATRLTVYQRAVPEYYPQQVEFHPQQRGALAIDALPVTDFLPLDRQCRTLEQEVDRLLAENKEYKMVTNVCHEAIHELNRAEDECKRMREELAHVKQDLEISKSEVAMQKAQLAIHSILDAHLQEELGIERSRVRHEAVAEDTAACDELLMVKESLADAHEQVARHAAHSAVHAVREAQLAHQLEQERTHATERPTIDPKVAEELTSIKQKLAEATEQIARHRSHIAVQSVREAQLLEALDAERSRALQPSQPSHLSQPSQPSQPLKEMEELSPQSADVFDRIIQHDVAEIRPRDQPAESGTATLLDTAEKQIPSTRLFTSKLGLLRLMFIFMGLGTTVALLATSYLSLSTLAACCAVVYTCVGAALWLVLRAPQSPQQERAVTLFWSQFLVSLSCALLVRLHATTTAFLDCCLLCTLVLGTLRQFGTVDRRAAWLLLPYVGWCFVATNVAHNAVTAASGRY